MDVPDAILHDLREVGRDLYRLGLVSSRGGNLSVRDGHAIFITGAGAMLGRLRARDVSRALPDGAHDPPPPSSDTVLHWTIYATTDAGAVAHAHPRHAVALSFGRDRFTPEDAEGRIHLREAPVVAPGPLQEQQLAEALREARVAILRGHGAYARAASLWDALHWLTALEESAHVAWLRLLAERGQGQP